MRRFTHFRWYRRHSEDIGIVLLGIVALISLFGVIDNSHADQARADKTHAALCALRADLIRRVEDGHDFLKTHPRGFAGYSRLELEANLANQQATINALSVASCHAGH